MLSSVSRVGLVSIQLALLSWSVFFGDFPVIALSPRGDRVDRQVVLVEADLDGPGLAFDPLLLEALGQRIFEQVERASGTQLLVGVFQSPEYVNVFNPARRYLPRVRADQDRVDAERPVSAAEALSAALTSAWASLA